MSRNLLLADDDLNNRKILRRALEGEGYHVVEAADGENALDVLTKEPVDLLITDVVMPGMDGIELLERARRIHPDLRAIVMTGYKTSEAVIGAFRNHACDFLTKPFRLDELLQTVSTALNQGSTCQIEVLSDKPDWIELRVPCDLQAVEPINKFLMELHNNIPQATREAISQVFREMLNNAIEHGGKCDINKRVEVKYIRLKRAVLYSIKDPGEGFDISQVEHAAFSNPEDDPFRHMQVRKEKGLRPGGFGIMLAAQVMDELIFNKQHNELVFVKYIDEPQESD